MDIVEKVQGQPNSLKTPRMIHTFTRFHSKPPQQFNEDQRNDARFENPVTNEVQFFRGRKSESGRKKAASIRSCSRLPTNHSLI